MKKKIIIGIFSLALATNLAACGGTDTAEVMQTETLTESLTEAVTESEITSSETAAETTSADIEEETNETEIADDGEKAAEYLSAMLECSEFTDIMAETPAAQIVDLNSDGIPEIIMSSFGYPTPELAVFSVDGDGKAFRAEQERELCLASEKVETYLTKDGEKLFLVYDGSGGSGAGYNELVALSLENGKLIRTMICGSEYEKDYNTLEIEESYYFGDKDNKMSEEEYNAELEKYMSELTKSEELSYFIKMGDISGDDRANALIEGLEIIYNPRGFRSVYKTFLTDLISQYGESEDLEGDPDVIRFDLFDIDSDGVPELFVSTGGFHQAQADIYTVENGSIVNLGSKGSGGYVKASAGYIADTYENMGCLNIEIFTKSGSALESKVLIQDHSQSVVSDKCYMLNGEIVSESELQDALDKYNTMSWYRVGRNYILNTDSVKRVLGTDADKYSELSDKKATALSD